MWDFSRSFCKNLKLLCVCSAGHVDIAMEEDSMLNEGTSSSVDYVHLSDQVQQMNGFSYIPNGFHSANSPLMVLFYGRLCQFLIHLAVASLYGFLKKGVHK